MRSITFDKPNKVAIATQAATTSTTRCRHGLRFTNHHVPSSVIAPAI